MRVTRAQAEQNHQTVIEVASRLFREHGFDGIGVNDLMNAAGLTRGGFYKRFESKDDLAAQACDRAVETGVRRLRRVTTAASGDPLAMLIRFYLSEAHRDRVGDGCPFAALGADAARSSPAVRTAMTRGVERYLDMLDGLMPPAADDTARDRSLTTFATLVGALVLSRAVTDEALSARFLDAAARDLISRTTETPRQEPPRA